MKTGINREILLALWKIHILHHAGEEPIVGNWMLRELRNHGYEASPGTVYPMLRRMEAKGWLTCERSPKRGPRAPRAYSLTRKGRGVLEELRARVAELHRELNTPRSARKKHP
jgi:PadR family transcriptional regulator PadR